MIHILIILSNIALYFVLAFLGSFIEFGIWGSGAVSEKYSKWVGLFLIALQIIFNIWLNTKRRFLKNSWFLLFNIAIIIGLYTYIVIYRR